MIIIIGGQMEKGAIPWKIKGEQKQFRELTTGNVVIMGRRSYEAIDMLRNKDGFIAGGYGLYLEAIPMVEVMYITEVDTVVEDGDTFFPEFGLNDFDMCIGETLGEEINYTRTIYRRKK